VKFAGIVAPEKDLCQDGIQPKNRDARNTAGIQSALLTLEKTGCTMCATRQGSRVGMVPLPFLFCEGGLFMSKYSKEDIIRMVREDEISS
jgi:hypothetical protein